MEDTNDKLRELVQLTNRIGNECYESKDEWIKLIEQMRDGTGKLTHDQLIERGNKILRSH